MGISGPKERATFTLDPAVREELEREIPSSERSGFVQEAIRDALKKIAKRRALKAIAEFKRYPLKGPDVVETLRQVRSERDEQLASRHRLSAK
jgi:hypothetical protein